MADSILPSVFEADLLVGESASVTKTVEVSAEGSTTALIDAYFLFDTSGSMGPQIAAAQAASAGILASIDAFGDAAGGVGAYAEQASLTLPPPGSTINQDINDDTSVGGAVDTAISNITLNNPDFGGDGPENGNTAIEQVAENASWRTGSNRFLFVFGDAEFKNSGVDDVVGDPISSDADVIDALTLNNIDLIGLSYGSGFSDSITALGGTVFNSTTDPDDIVDDITDGIIGAFADYDIVSVSALGGGLPDIGVTAECVTADIGVCSGDEAVGDFDRSVDRSFTFNVTYTRLSGSGTSTFDTFALVDGGIVASQTDTITGSAPPIPLPAGVWLLLGGIGTLTATRWTRLGAPAGRRS